MNKYCSLLIILLIIYLTYDYCSNIVEGQDGQDDQDDQDNKKKFGSGGYDETSDDYVPETCPYNGTIIGGIKKISDGVDKGVTNPCDYKTVSCSNTIPKASDWGNMFTSEPNGNDTANNLKRQCQLCVIGSKADGTITNTLANVSRIPDSKSVPNSHFAYDLCDAMVAGCDKSIFYANNRQDGWNKDCGPVDSTTWANNKLNIGICKVLKSSILQFLLGFMGGIECTMKIKSYELKGYMDAKMDSLEKPLKAVSHKLHIT